MKQFMAVFLASSILVFCTGCSAGSANFLSGSATTMVASGNSTSAIAASEIATSSSDASTISTSAVAASPTAASATASSVNSGALPLSDFYGNYVFKEASVLSALSSATIGYINERSAGQTYTINDNVFEIRGSDQAVTYENPTYEPCEISGDGDGINKGFTDYTSARRVDAVYKILDENKEPTHLKLYTSSEYPDRVWISDYCDNTATGTEIIVQSMDMLLCSCQYPPNASQMDKHITGTKDKVKDLIDLLDQKGWDMATTNYGYEFSYDTVYNITPPEIAAAEDFQIFKCSTSCLSILEYKGQCYELGIGFGGYGLVDMMLYDCNGDGASDLLYTYSWGSGLHRSCAAYFDFVKGESIVLDVTGGEDEIMLVQNANGGVNVYKAIYGEDLDGTSFIDFKLHAGDFVAEM